MGIPLPLSTLAQALSILLLGLLAGAVFAVWAGYNPTTYTPPTFLEVMRGAVGGLNVLLPVLAVIAFALVVGLAIAARSRPTVLWLYVATALAIAAGGLITRFINQPINAEVVGWTIDALPADWESIRQTWWTAHIARLAVVIAAELLLLVSVFTDRAG